MKLAKSWMRGNGKTAHSVSIDKEWGAYGSKQNPALGSNPSWKFLPCPFLVKNTPGLAEPPLSIMVLGHMEEKVGPHSSNEENKRAPLH